MLDELNSRSYFEMIILFWSVDHFLFNVLQLDRKINFSFKNWVNLRVQCIYNLHSIFQQKLVYLVTNVIDLFRWLCKWNFLSNYETAFSCQNIT